MNAKVILCASVCLTFLASCSPSKTIVDTSCPGYKQLGITRDALADGRIGIMPVLGGNEKEQYRRPMGEALAKYLVSNFGESNVIPPAEVIHMTNAGNITGLYTQAINDYTITGIVPRDMTSQIADVLGVKYLLYTKLLSDSEISTFYDGYSYKTFRVDEIYIQCQVWDAHLGDIVWEGKGGTSKIPSDPTNVIEKTAEGLASVLGNDINDGPCETKKTLLNSMQIAYFNTYLSAAGITLVICLTILALI